MSVTPAPSSTAMLRKLDEATTGLQESFDVAAVVPRQAVRGAREATDRRARWFWLPLVLVAAVGASTLTAVIMYFVFAPQIDQVRSAQTATVAAGVEVRRIAEEARVAAVAANAELERLGQEPVTLPVVGQAPDADVLVSAATAQVLAALPRNQAVTAELVAQEVARFMAANPITPVGPSPGQIADAVAAYLQAFPPPQGVQGIAGEQGRQGERGERGEQGVPGQDAPALTGEQIRAALDSYFLDNPIPPCPAGTALQEVRFGNPLGPSGLACVFTEDM